MTQMIISVTQTIEMAIEIECDSVAEAEDRLWGELEKKENVTVIDNNISMTSVQFNGKTYTLDPYRGTWS